jgi:uncharacterized protein YbjT (DUF2867 family)
MTDSRILVVGATGLLGRQVARLLCEAKKKVRALVRTTSDSQTRDWLQTKGVELAYGDLKDADSLRQACANIDTVVSTASATLSRQPGDSIATVDEGGQLALVKVAREAGVRRFVLVSFAPTKVDCALQRAKRKVEAALVDSSMQFTVLQPTDFADVWLSPALGFDPVHGKARILGTGEQPVSWVAMSDVARFAVAAVESEIMTNKTILLGGPDALTPLQVVRIFEEQGAPKVELEFVPESALEAQLAKASDAVEEAFAALMLSTARGIVVNARDSVQLLPGQLTTVRDFAKRVLKG